METMGEILKELRRMREATERGTSSLTAQHTGGRAVFDPVHNLN